MKKEDILRFLFAGNATFTIKSKKTGKHYTYVLKQSKKHKHIYFLTFGKQNAGRIFNKTKFVAGYGELGTIEEAILPFEWWFNHLDSEHVEFFHEGKCGRCGRALTDPESIERGIGPECAKQFALTEDF